jgi:3-methyladenine DNA glycosylase AlkD
MAAAKPARSNQTSLTSQVKEVLGWLERHGTRQTRDGMARYAIPADKAFGVPMRTMQQFAKTLGRNHDLALALWQTGWYEARTVAAFIAEPERVTAAQMDRWSREFDNWALCDTVCFHLFDRTPHAFRKVEQWARRKDEIGKRAAFALLACLAAHNKQAGDEVFLQLLPLAEEAAVDGRNFVKKGVSWALRLVGCRNGALYAATLDVARRLSGSANPAARWVGKDVARDLSRPAMIRRLQNRG